MRRLLEWVLALLSCATPAVALDPQRPVTQYDLFTWRVRDGLPHNVVTTVLQTADGFLWVGTAAGLARFDGVRFTVFNSFNTPELPDDNITALCRSKQGGLWIGTRLGDLVRWKDGRFQSVRHHRGGSEGYIRALLEDRKGTLWVARYGEGLDRLEGGRFETYDTSNGLSNNFARALFESRDGSLWIGTYGGGLNRLRDGQWTHYTARHGLSNEFVTSICEGRDGGLWVGTRAGLNRLERERLTTYGLAEGLSHEFVWALYEDRDGVLWIGTSGGGMDRFAGGRFANLSSRNGRLDDLVHTIHEDTEGNLWVGGSQGLARLQDRPFMAYTKQDGLSHDIVWPIYETRDGSLWIGTFNAGLDRLRNGRFEHYDLRHGLSSRFVSALWEDRDGALWVGTDGGGLNRLKDGRFTRYGVAEGLSNAFVTAVVEDRDGVLWVGTRGGGLNRREGGAFTVFSHRDGLSSDTVWTLEAGREGLWIGTYGAGLNQLRGGRFLQYRSVGPASMFVTSIHEDDRGRLWVGTEGGLARLKDGQLTTYAPGQGLPRETIHRIVEDDHECLWLSCDSAIFRVRKRDLLALDRGEIESVVAASYGGSYGVGGKQGQPAGWKSRDGRIWFPADKGLVVIDPAKLRPAEPRFPVYIEDFLVDNERWPAQPSPRLPAGKRALVFQYTALSFREPQSMRFRYILEGFDPKWVEAGTRRAAVYMNLPPRRYSFRVTARGSEGVWNPIGASLDFSIAPHFYHTALFRVLCGVVLVLLGGAAYRLHLMQVHSRYSAILAERSRIARDIHDTVVQGVVAIGIQLEAIGGKLRACPDEALKHVELARSMARRSVAEARRSVSDLRGHALERRNLADGLSQFAQQLRAISDATVSLRVEGRSRPVPSGVEDHLLRIGQEALANAVKHARARSIRVDLAFDDGWLVLRVKDDGAGFDLTRVRSLSEGHYGLLGMQERARALGGRLDVRSAPESGTEVVCRVPTVPGRTARDLGVEEAL